MNDQDTVDAVASLRITLCEHANTDVANAQANALIEHVNNTLNDAGISTADSLLARALVVNGVLRVAASWWSDLTGVDKEHAMMALQSFIYAPPPGVRTVEWVDEEAKAASRKGMN